MSTLKDSIMLSQLKKKNNSSHIPSNSFHPKSHYGHLNFKHTELTYLTLNILLTEFFGGKKKKKNES